MGWDISIVDGDGKVVKAHQKHQISGGTYAVGGQEELQISETFNYSSTLKGLFPSKHVYDEILYGVWVLDGLAVEDAKPLLVRAVNKLIEEAVAEGVSLMPHDNYWEPVLGNVLAMLMRMLELSRLGNGYWRIEG